MIRAASHGSLSLLKQFVKWDADLNAPDHPTALYEAAQGGHLETVKFILEHGVDVNAKAGWWGCALAAAAAEGKIELVKYLLNHGADPNAHDDILNYAIHGGLEIVKMLIDKGANLQVQGEDALYNAVTNRKLDIVKLLIEKGVSLKKGQILHTACHWGSLEVVQFLVENGVDINALDRWGTALWAAIDRNKKEVVEFLIQSGADVNATGDNSKTPLQLAIQRGYKEIEHILRRHGARE
ncbi:ankyrin repeat-containing protein [Mycena floridula]|nr:ankyrin repeat-containing protein [Mycena floridula]KAJ7595626.1 ankyrin repeat-containing protein [Mycena floridula]